MMIECRNWVRDVKVFVLALAVFVTSSSAVAFAQGKVTLKVLSHRFPATEFYVQEMGKSVEGVNVEAKFMPFDKVLELTRISLSGGQVSPHEIVFAYTGVLPEYAAKDWLEPLDKYIEKYRKEYEFDDIPKNIWNVCSYQGRIYALPVANNALFFFYRKDLFDKYNLKPPKTFDQYLDAAKKIQENESSIFGTTLTLKAEQLINTFHIYLLGYGGRWFDQNNVPVFNGAEGVKALTMLKNTMKYAPQGVLSYHNDQSMVALQQGMVAMGIQFFTRASAMDDPKVSKVVGKIEFAAPPSGKEGVPGYSALGGDFYTIPKNLPAGVDKDLVFRVIAGAIRKERMKIGAKYALPPRDSILNNPGDVGQRWWPAARETLASAVPLPMIAEFPAMFEKISYELSRALAGETGVQAALDKAVKECEAILKKK